MSEFVHLHNHTHYSLQDAACTVDDLINAAVTFKQPALALTDHGVMYGAWEFYHKAVNAGIKPIIGMEAYITIEGSRFDKKAPVQTMDGRKKKNYHHLILLAKNREGYQNLAKLSTLGFKEGFYYKPRIDWELLQKYHKGLICTSACLGGIISYWIIQGNYKKAKETAEKYKNLFGDDFYLELQDHGLDGDKAVLEQVPKLSKELGIKMIATNDIHYIKKEHAIAHNVLLMLSDKSADKDYKKLRYNTDQIYFKSSEEMIELFKDYDGAIENTLEIADKIELKFDQKESHFPVFPIPKESKSGTLEEYLEELARKGLEERYGKENITKELEDRFAFELKTIIDMGFPGYFLIVQDFINAAKKMGVPVGPGRGSAAGSLIAYSLGITNIDPMEYNLLFERFLNPARNTMPDIDVDFADEDRGRVIDYVRETYGDEAVCQIVTFNTLASKAAIRDVARVVGVPIPTVNNITKHIPSAFGKVYSIEKSINEVPELKWVKQSDDPKIHELIKYAKVLEGMNRNTSKHAAGVVITPGDTSDFVPLAVANAKDGNGGEIVSQYQMNELEDAGLLKMDFLGLRTLTIIKDTLTLIKKNHGEGAIGDIDDIDIYDKKTFELFAKGQTTGIFQFESPPMREYLKRLKPQSIKDLSAMNALYRPGPMAFIDEFIDKRFGRKDVVYLHETLEPILKETYGIIVYQEQVIQIANKFAGMSLADADILRRAMGKKKMSVMEAMKVQFVDGAKEKGIPEKISNKVWDHILDFAKYGFNKSHAVAYSFVAYQTAYLKAHFPAEFLAANLTNEFGNQDKVAAFLDDCRKMKIHVMPPDVNNPSVYFDVTDSKIKFGLSAIKNVGISAVEEIIRAKNEINRNFTSLFDFCEACDTSQVNKRTLEGLVLAGAFDSVYKNRKQLFEHIGEAIEFGANAKRAKAEQANSLFGDMSEEMTIPEPEMRPVDDYSEREKLTLERNVTGFYISGHPLRKYELEYKSFPSVYLGQTGEMEQTETARVCGVITDIRTKIDKKGKTMAFFTLNGLTGNCESLMFGSGYEKYGDFIKPEEPVFAIGRPESSGDSITLYIDEIIPMEQAREIFTKFIRIKIDPTDKDITVISNLKDILDRHRGKHKVIVELLRNGDKSRVFSLHHAMASLSDEFIEDVTNLLGEGALEVESK